MGDLAGDDRGHGMGIVVESDTKENRFGYRRSRSIGTTRVSPSETELLLSQTK
jgi:hypothetical protein